MTVLPAFCFSPVDDGQSFFHKVSYVSRMAGCLGMVVIIIFFSVEYSTIEIGIDSNISEKCLAGLLHVKGEKGAYVFLQKNNFPFS